MTESCSSRSFTTAQIILILVSVASFLAISLRILIFHPLNWDEGWNLTPAVNLIEHGHYGVYLEGKPIPPVLSGTPALLIVCAAGVKIFGAGIWQPRLLFFLISCIGVSIVFLLSYRLHGRTTAVFSLALATLLTPLNLTLAFHGSQIFGEVPMLTLVLGGIFVLAGTNPWRGIYAAILFSLAINFKVQLGPMLLASVAFVVALKTIRRRYKAACMLTAIALATYFLANFVNPLLVSTWIDTFTTIKADAARVLPQDYSRRIISLLTLNYDLRFALRSLGMFVDCAPFFIFVALFVGLQIFKENPARTNQYINLVKSEASTLLNALALVWTTWFLLFSVGYPRYLFPAIAMLTPAATCLLETVFQSSVKWYQQRHLPNASSISAILGFAAIALLACQAIWTARLLVLPFTLDWQPLATLRVADKVNQIAGENLVIESVESEIFPFVNAKYYFPNEYEIMKHAEALQSNQSLDRAAWPAIHGDLVVIGGFAKLYGWYPEEQWRDNYSTIYRDGAYQIIRRSSQSKIPSESDETN